MAVELPELSGANLPAIALRARVSERSRLGALRETADIWLPGGVFALIALACFIWPLVYSLRSPTEGNLTVPNVFPLSPHYLLGTDPLGIDILSRVLYGGRVSIEVGLGSNAIGMAIGSALGIVAGFRSGFTDALIMRILDTLLAFPPLILAITISNYLGPSELHVIWAISFFSIPAFARLSRAATLRLRDQPFVVASSLSGSRDWRILFRHILPNVVPQLMTFAFLGVAVAIIVEAALSFLGLGVPPPGPSWGNMIAEGQTYLPTDPYLVLIPSAFLFATVMSLNLLCDAVRMRWSADY
jgi:peptide/nickel transport system permease protein